MSSKNQIDIIITTLFDSRGIKSGRKALSSLNKEVSKLRAAFSAAEEVISARRLQGKMKKIGITATDIKTKFGHSVKKIVAFKDAEEAARQKTIALNKELNKQKAAQAIAAKKAAETTKKLNQQKKASERLARATKKSEKNMGGFISGIRQASPVIQGMQKQMDMTGNKATRMGAGLGAWTQSFSMWALSVMFFGMAVQRVFTSIASAGVKSFLKITESTGMQASALQQLGAHWEFLKFSIGSAINDALGPLLPKIFEIISAITAWIQEHPELTAKILAWGAAIGGVLFVLGTLILGVKGVVAFMAVLATVFSSNSAVAMGIKFLIGLFAGLSAPVLIVFGIILAIIVGFVIAWKENFGGIREWFGVFIEGLKNFFGGFIDFIKALWNFWVALFKGDTEGVKKAFKAMIDAVKRIWLGLKQTIVGLFVVIGLSVLRFLKLMYDGVKNVLKVIYEIFKDVWGGILGWLKDKFIVFWNWFSGTAIGKPISEIITTFTLAFQEIFVIVKNIFRDIITFVVGALNKAIGLINAVIRGMNLMPKVNIPRIPSVKLPQFEKGGMVPGVGPQLAIVHGGEAIIPKKDVGGIGTLTIAPNITINTPAGTSVDARSLANEVSEIIMREVRAQTGTIRF